MNQAKAITSATLEQSSAIAIVTETRNGEALKLSDRQGREITLRGHLSQVPWLQPGDEVLIADTPEGAIISGRLRRVGEKPQATLSVQENGIALMGDRPLCLQVGESRIELKPDGRVLIEGKVVTQVATDSMQLFGPVVEVN